MLHNVTVREKQCGHCREVKNAGSFYKDTGRKGGLASTCKTCCAEATKRYSKTPKGRVRYMNWKNRDPIKARRASHRASLKKLYGITLENYEQLLNGQDGKCAVCKRSNPGARHSVFSVDHCHETGKIRGLLCANCNSGLGHFKESVGALKGAIEYLNNHPTS